MESGSRKLLIILLFPYLSSAAFAEPDSCERSYARFGTGFSTADGQLTSYARAHFDLFLIANSGDEGSASWYSSLLKSIATNDSAALRRVLVQIPEGDRDRAVRLLMVAE